MGSYLADHEKLAIELLLASIIPVAPQLNGALHCDREFVGLILAYRKKELQTAIGGYAI